MKEQITSLLIVHSKGEDEYFGADAAAVFKQIKAAQDGSTVITPPIHLDDSNEDIIYNLMHIVSITARKGAF